MLHKTFLSINRKAINKNTTKSHEKLTYSVLSAKFVPHKTHNTYCQVI